jgi:hypothetical protein
MNGKMLAAAVLGLGLLWAVGCDTKKEAPKPEDKKQPDGDDHEHGPGPHGGVIIEFDKYHAEFKPDHAKKEATVWMLKADAKTAARVKADKLRLVVSNTNPKIEIDLLPTDKAPDGTASTFVGKHDGFAVEMEYKGTVSARIDGKPYSGDFEEKPDAKK